jgi:Peroxidase
VAIYRLLVLCATVASCCGSAVHVLTAAHATLAAHAIVCSRVYFVSHSRDSIQLEPIKAKYPGLTYSDLWTLAGSVAIEEMGGPPISWRQGRTDADKPTTVPDGKYKTLLSSAT